MYKFASHTPASWRLPVTIICVSLLLLLPIVSSAPTSNNTSNFALSFSSSINDIDKKQLPSFEIDISNRLHDLRSTYPTLLVERVTLHSLAYDIHRYGNLQYVIDFDTLRPSKSYSTSSAGDSSPTTWHSPVITEQQPDLRTKELWSWELRKTITVARALDIIKQERPRQGPWYSVTLGKPKFDPGPASIGLLQYMFLNIWTSPATKVYMDASTGNIWDNVADEGNVNGTVRMPGNGTFQPFRSLETQQTETARRS